METTARMNNVLTETLPERRESFPLQEQALVLVSTAPGRPAAEILAERLAEAGFTAPVFIP